MVSRLFVCVLRGVAAVLTLVLAACSQDEVQQVEKPVRAIKYMTLEARAGSQIRRLAGVVKPGISSNSAFEIAGRIIELNVDVGDAVKQGDVLARLDPEPFELQVRETENNLQQFRAQLDDARKKFEQQRTLYEKQITTKTAFDTADANLKQAIAAVDLGQTQVDQARRNLRKVNLVAPFNGTIGEKSVNVFEEVQAGATIYVIQTEGQEKIEVSLPETLINDVVIGQEVRVSLPAIELERAVGVIEQVSPKTGDANAYPVTVRLTNPDARVRAGMSARVRFAFETEATGKAFRVPLAAVVPKTREAKDQIANIFVFDKDQSVVRSRTIEIVGVVNNELEIVGELKTGDVVATAGVSFLHDGMKVKLLSPETFE